VPWHLQIREKQNVPAFFQALAEHCDFTKFEPHSFAAGGDHVYCSVDAEITIKKNGKKLKLNNEMHRFTLKNGKVTEWRGAEDTATVVKAFEG